MNHTDHFQTLEKPINLEKAVGEFERSLIIQALEKCDGVQTRAAQHLGTTRRILRYRMDKLGIQLPHEKHP
jgi:two-component system response regulator AtoC